MTTGYVQTKIREDGGTSGPVRSYLVQQGAAGGFIAGITFILFEMVIAWPMDGDFFKPLRMIASLILGRNALEQWNSLLAICLLAPLILFIVAPLLGAFFGRLIAQHPSLIGSSRRLTVTGCLYACLLWIGFYYILAPVVGWTWFALQTEPILQGFIGHTLFFGAVLGWFLSRRLARPTVLP